MTMDAYRLRMSGADLPAPRHPSHEPGFGVGPSRPPHQEIISVLDWLSRQIAEGHEAGAAGIAALDAKIEALTAAVARLAGDAHRPTGTEG